MPTLSLPLTVKDRPLAFSAPMVIAAHEVRKDHTRRTRGLNYINKAPELWDLSSLLDGKAIFNLKMEQGVIEQGCISKARHIYSAVKPLQAASCPYGRPGDHLWVRETWASQGFIFCCPEASPNYQDKTGLWHPVIHKAGTENYAWGMLGEPKWKPAMFMPKSASRMTLEITEVDLKRVQSISGDDVIHEGVTYPLSPESKPLLRITGNHPPSDYLGPDLFKDGDFIGTEDDWLKAHYAALWDDLNAARGLSWALNPWVWVIGFKVVKNYA